VIAATIGIPTLADYFVWLDDRQHAFSSSCQGQLC
jgi:hypothetical protein